MPESYVIKPPTRRTRPADILQSIDSKLDTLLRREPDSGGEDTSESGSITFSANDDDLPTSASIEGTGEGEGDDDTDDTPANGEGTENVAHPVRRAFRHPSARRTPANV